MDLENIFILKAYKLQLKNDNKSINTINTYLTNIKSFLVWLQERYGETDVTAITSLDIMEYQDYLLNIKKYKASGIRQRMYSIISYCKFIYDKGYVKNNPADNFKIIKIQNTQNAPNIITKQEMNLFRREVYKSNNKRNIAIIEMLKGTGIRVSELISLEVNDIFLSERKGIIKIRKGKGGKYREIPLNKAIRKSLRDYLNSRNSSSNKLWIGQRGPLTKDSINKMLKRYAVKVNLQDKIHPHVFRHYLAHELLRVKKKDPILVSHILGHSNINTLKIYTQPTLDELEEALEEN